MRSYRWRITQLGSFPGMLILLLPFCIGVSLEAIRLILVVSAIFIIFPLLLAIITKLFYHKDRPIPQKRGTFINTISAGSFPSMHTIVATVIAIIVSVSVFSEYGYGSRWIIVTYVLLAILVGTSRVKLKKHYRIDVIFGAVYAIVGSAILYFLIQKFILPWIW